MAKFTGTAGDDNLTGTSGNDKFSLGQGGNDTASGGDGNDQFIMNATLTAADRIDGGAGTDTVTLKGDYSAGLIFDAATIVGIEKLHLLGGFDYNLTTNDANVAAGARLTVNATPLKAGDSLTFDGSAETDGAFTIQSGAGDDVLTGGALRDIFVLSKGGNDTVHGGAGNDLFTMAGSFNSADQLDGGTGPDTLSLDGNYSGANSIVMGANTITNIETIVLAGGHTYNLTTNDGNVAAGQALTVDASAIASAFVFNGAAETDGSFVIIGGTGNDTLSGGNAGNTFDLTHGGHDTANGGQGVNVFNLGASFETLDRINGAPGANNTMILNGAYSGLTVTNTMIANIQTLDIQGTNAASLIWKQSGALTVDASAAGGSLTFDFSAVTSALHYIGGALNAQINGGVANDTFDGGSGTDIFNGNNGNDVFNLGGGFTAADRIDGGAGSDILTLNGDYGAGVTFGATTVTNVETLQLLSSGHDYNITTDDTTVGAGLTFTVDGSALTSARHLTFNGAAETNGSFAITGGAGSDTLTGGALSDSFNLSLGGNDVAHGNGGNDTFVMAAAFGATDSIDGGTGTDTLILNGDYSAGVTFGAATITNIETLQLAAGHSYNLTPNDANVGSGQSLTVDGSALGAGDVLTFNGVKELDGSFTVLAGAGNDVLTGGALADSFDLTLGGNDTVHGGGGNDVFTLGTAFSAADAIDGGAGNDTLLLNGDYSVGITFSAATVTGIETMQLAAGHSYAFTSNNGNVASGQTMTIDGSALGNGDTMTFNGGAEADGSFAFIAGVGANTLTGGAQADTFDLTRVSGSAVVHGGGGNDTFTLGAAFTAGADAIDGGAGNDTLVLNGDYSTGIAFGPSTLSSIETLQLAAGHSYSFTSNDNSVASGATMTVDGSALGAGDALTFDGTAEQDGSFAFLGGAGNDTLNGGAQADSFDLTRGGIDVAHGGNGNDTFAMGATLTAADTIDGGAGNDTISLSGDYSAGLVLGAAMVTSIEALQLGAGHSYNLTTDDAAVAAGQTFTVDASALGASDTLTFNGSAELDGSFTIIAGGGNATLTGGAQGDIFSMGSTFTASDQIDGGAGTDKLIFNGDYSAGLVLGASTVVNVETFQFSAGHSYNITANDGNVAAGQTLTVDGSTMGANDVLTFNGGAESDGNFAFVAGAGNDVLTGGALADTFDLTHGGNDTASGGNGNDMFMLGATLTASDVIDGGAGNDTLILNGAYGGVTFGASTFTGIEQLQLVAGHSYNFNTADGNVASGQTLTIDGSTLGSTDVLVFNGGAETDGSFAITGGLANDLITGGAQADSFDLSKGGNDTVHGGGGNDIFSMAGALTAADVLDGGTGTDTLVLNGNYSAGVTFSATTMVNFETLQLADSNNYKLTLNDANVASGATLTVDASQLEAANTLTFNAAAETNGAFIITAGAGSDTITAGAGNDSFDLTLGGNDNVSGGGGNDIFNFGATFNPNDTVDGGTGNDTVLLNGDYASQLTELTSMTNVETMILAAGHNYKFGTIDQLVASGATFTVDASALGASDVLTFTGGNEHDGHFYFIGGAGNDVLSGGAVSDTFDLSLGGDDTVTNSHGTYLMGAALTAADRISGSGTVVLNGDYSGGLVLGATTLTNITAMQFIGGHNYNITANDATILSNAQSVKFNIIASSLTASDSLIFDASADTNGSVVFTGGAGNSTINAGARFWDDTFVGGTGKDIIVLNGDYTGENGGVIQSYNATNIEGLIFTAGHSYTFSVWQNVFTAGVVATIDASALGVSDKLSFNGSLLGVNVPFYVTGGAGDDVMTSVVGTIDLTHGGNDTVISSYDGTVLMGATLTTADSISAGKVVLDGDYSSGLTFGAATVTGAAVLQVMGGHSYDIATNDATVASGKTLIVDATTLGVSDVLTFSGASESNGAFYIAGGAGNDSLTGGAGADTFDLTWGGADFVQGLGGNDTFNVGVALTASDYIDGGTGNDTLNLSGDYSAGLVFGATTITNIETIKLGAGFSYNLTMNDANVGGGTTMTIDGSSSNRLIFDGSAETDGKFIIRGSAGDDIITGSAGNDSFDLGGGGHDTVHGSDGNDFFNNFSTNDTVDGGAGSDTILMPGLGANTNITLSATAMVSVETFEIGGQAYNVTFNDANVLAGQTLALDTSTDSNGGTVDLSADTDSFFTITSGTGNDTVIFGADFRAADTFNGNSGADTLSLAGNYSALVLGATTVTNVETVLLASGFSYNITTNDGNLTSTQTLKFDASALGASDIFTFNGSAETNGSYNIIGGAGNDVLTGGGGNDTFDLTHGGMDNVHGNGGADTFTLGAIYVPTNYMIDGGAGTDVLSLNGDYTGAQAITLNGVNLTNVEDIVLGAGHSYTITTVDTLVAAGGTIEIDGGTNAVNVLTFDGSAELDGTFYVIGGVGNDALTGGALGDTLDISKGGADTVHGGGGDDIIQVGSQFSASDLIDGGTGNDTLYFSNGYAGILSNVSNVEKIVITSSAASLTPVDSVVGAGLTLTVDASGAPFLTFNGASETDGHFYLIGGNGNDALTGGALSDTFDISRAGEDTVHGGGGDDIIYIGGAWDTAGDLIDGGAGNDTLVLFGSYNISFGLQSLNSVETLLMTAGGGRYSVALNDVNVGAGATLTVDGSGLFASDQFSFATNDTNSFFHLIGGASTSQSLSGGALGDTFDMTHAASTYSLNGGSGGDDLFLLGASFNKNNSFINGGTGTDNDTVNFSGDYSTNVTFGINNFTSIETMSFGAGFTYKFTTNDANVASGATLTVDASALTTTGLTFNGIAETNGSFAFIGGAGNDAFTGGAQADTFDLSHGGNDGASGNGGNDTFIMGAALTAADSIDGGAGINTITLNGDYSAGVTFVDSAIVNIQTFQVAAGHSYNLTTNNGMVAAGATLTADGSALGAGDSFVFNGAAETDGKFVMIGGAGNDTFTGGAQADSFDLSHGGTDTVTGGGAADTITAFAAGGDTFVYGAVSDSTSTQYDTIVHTNFDTDLFNVSAIAAVTGVDAAVTAGALSTASFDSDLSATVGAGQLSAHHALLFTADSGTLSGHTFLVVDENGIAGYQANGDLVIDVTGAAGTLTASDFI